MKTNLRPVVRCVYYWRSLMALLASMDRVHPDYSRLYAEAERTRDWCLTELLRSKSQYQDILLRKELWHRKPRA